MYITHDFIVPNSVEFREYQINIASSSSKENTLVVLPTGLGKTIIALLLIARKLKESQKKILFLAPTKPLVIQHAQFLREFLTIDDGLIPVFTGELSPKKRQELWGNSRVIVSTPQVIENDLLSKRITLQDVSLIIYDEAHHAVGRYAYVFIAEMYRQQGEKQHVLGMTASPGRDMEKILEVCKNLNIRNIEIRTKHDRDVKPYVHELNITWKHVSVPREFSFALQLLRKSLSERLQKLKDIGVIDSASIAFINKTKLLDTQKVIQSAIRDQVNPAKELFEAAALQSEALKIYYAIELLQTQGIEAVKRYFSRLQQEAKSKSSSKSSKKLMADADFLDAIAYIKSLHIEHPKFAALKEIISDQFRKKPESRVIVFTHFRDTSSAVVEALGEVKNARAVRFIGQSLKTNDKGLTQKQQAEIIQKFKQGEYNVLVATSVAEEGLDIPSTELVIFYEPIPSEIRNIQRRGRTGRKMPGRIIILITKGTQDEGYYWASKRREKQMRMDLELLRAKLSKRVELEKSFSTLEVKGDNKQKTLEDFKANEEEITIIVDHREYRSDVVRRLAAKNVSLKSQQLDVGDYVLSTRIGVERKQVDDFLSSLIKGTLFQQINKLRDAYARPLLIIEGEDLFKKRNISHNAIFGSFVSIIVDFGIPILFTKNAFDTADVLFITAAREQKEKQKDVAVRGGKPSASLRERQQFIVEGLPNVSSVIAQRLLDHFGSIRAIANASEDELQEVHGIGPLIASDIYRVFNAEFDESEE